MKLAKINLNLNTGITFSKSYSNPYNLIRPVNKI